MGTYNLFSPQKRLERTEKFGFGRDVSNFFVDVLEARSRLFRFGIFADDNL